MRRLHLFDYAAIALSFIAVGVLSVSAYGPRPGVPELEIQAPAGTYLYPLSTDRRIVVDGPLGATVITIANGRVEVSSSPCPDKLCVKAPALTKPGEWNACLPNRIFVRIEGRHDRGEHIDALSF